MEMARQLFAWIFSHKRIVFVYVPLALLLLFSAYTGLVYLEWEKDKDASLKKLARYKKLIDHTEELRAGSSYSYSDVDLQAKVVDIPTRIYDRSGKVIGEFFEQKREIVPYNSIPRWLVNAVIAALTEAGVPADRIQSVQGRKTEPVEKSTALICMPALKAHQLTGLGTVLKNYIAFSGKGSSFHGENNGDLGSVWLMPVVKGKTRIVIVDALRPLFDKGPKPDPKYFWNYNGLLVGTDPVAVEATGLSIIMAKRKAYKGETWELTPPPLCVAAADKKYGLGTSDPAKIALKVSGWDKDVLISA